LGDGHDKAALLPAPGTVVTEQNRRCILNNCKDMLGQITEFELKASRIVAEEIL
jgi:hypothetical protein